MLALALRLALVLMLVWVMAAGFGSMMASPSVWCGRWWRTIEYTQGCGRC